MVVCDMPFPTQIPSGCGMFLSDKGLIFHISSTFLKCVLPFGLLHAPPVLPPADGKMVLPQILRMTGEERDRGRQIR